MSEPAKPLAQRVREAVDHYGPTFIVTGLVLFAIQMAALVTLFQVGIDIRPTILRLSHAVGISADGVVAAAGSVGVAYAITRLFKPVSLLLTLAITPSVDRLWRALRGQTSDDSASPPS